MSLLLPGAALLLLIKKDDQAVAALSTDAWTRFDSLFKKHASTFGVKNWMYLKAIALNESSLGAHPSVARGLAKPSDTAGSTSSDGKSWGLMQVTLTTARDMDPSATPTKLNDADYSVNLGARYVAKLQKMFSTSDPRWLEWVIKGYNQGPGNSIKERDRVIAKGYADEYWARFQRNLERVQARP